MKIRLLYWVEIIMGIIPVSLLIFPICFGGILLGLVFLGENFPFYEFIFLSSIGGLLGILGLWVVVIEGVSSIMENPHFYWVVFLFLFFGEISAFSFLLYFGISFGAFKSSEFMFKFFFPVFLAMIVGGKYLYVLVKKR